MTVFWCVCDLEECVVVGLCLADLILCKTGRDGAVKWEFNVNKLAQGEVCTFL